MGRGGKHRLFRLQAASGTLIGRNGHSLSKDNCWSWPWFTKLNGVPSILLLCSFQTILSCPYISHIHKHAHTRHTHNYPAATPLVPTVSVLVSSEQVKVPVRTEQATCKGFSLGTIGWVKAQYSVLERQVSWHFLYLILLSKWLKNKTYIILQSHPVFRYGKGEPWGSATQSSFHKS